MPLKVLPEIFTRDPVRLARFDREARVLASPNHPNIEAIYGMGQDKGIHFLVLELVLGETLRERVARAVIRAASQSRDCKGATTPACKWKDAE